MTLFKLRCDACTPPVFATAIGATPIESEGMSFLRLEDAMNANLKRLNTYTIVTTCPSCNEESNESETAEAYAARCCPDCRAIGELGGHVNW